MSLTVTAVPPGASSLTLRSANLTLTVLPPIPRSSTCYEDFGSTRPHQRAMVRRECVHILNRLARSARPELHQCCLRLQSKRWAPEPAWRPARKLGH
jgi:hypothetical protein